MNAYEISFDIGRAKCQDIYLYAHIRTYIIKQTIHSRCLCVRRRVIWICLSACVLCESPTTTTTYTPHDNHITQILCIWNTSHRGAQNALGIVVIWYVSRFRVVVIRVDCGNNVVIPLDLIFLLYVLHIYLYFTFPERIRVSTLFAQMCNTLRSPFG